MQSRCARRSAHCSIPRGAPWQWMLQPGLASQRFQSWSRASSQHAVAGEYAWGFCPTCKSRRRLLVRLFMLQIVKRGRLCECIPLLHVRQASTQRLAVCIIVNVVDVHDLESCISRQPKGRRAGTKCSQLTPDAAVNRQTHAAHQAVAFLAIHPILCRGPAELGQPGMKICPPANMFSTPPGGVAHGKREKRSL